MGKFYFLFFRPTLNLPGNKQAIKTGSLPPGCLSLSAGTGGKGEGNALFMGLAAGVDVTHTTRIIPTKVSTGDLRPAPPSPTVQYTTPPAASAMGPQAER